MQIAGCSFDLATSSPTYPPHLIDTDNNIILPVMQDGQRTINLNQGQRVTVGCLVGSSSNSLIVTGQQVLLLQFIDCSSRLNLIGLIFR